MKIKKTTGKLKLDDFITKDLVKIINNQSQSKIYGGYKTEGRAQSWNVEDCRSSGGYWLYCFHFF